MRYNSPFFSLIIPTYRRRKSLKCCMEALSESTYPKERFEVIVVDDDNDSSMADFLSPFNDKLQLLIISQYQAGPAAARNMGREHSRGKYLLFTDDDCRPTPKWLESMAECITKEPDCAVIGRTINKLTDNIYSATTQYIIDYLFEYYNSDPEDSHFATSNNLALPVSHFDKIGGFDASFTYAAGEDRDLCDRWRHHGLRIIYTPEALVHHYHALSLYSFLKQHFNYGGSAFLFHKKRVARKSGDKRLESAKFYIRLLAYPLSSPFSRKSIITVMLLALSQAATAAGYFTEKKRDMVRDKATLNL